MTENDSRRRGDAAFIAGLAAGSSVIAAAERAGISEATAHRRLRDPSFRRQLDEARAEIVARAVAALTAASVEAVQALRALLHSDLDFARLAAARAILELGVRMREQHDLTERVAALEAALEVRKEEPWRPRTAS